MGGIGKSNGEIFTRWTKSLSKTLHYSKYWVLSMGWSDWSIKSKPTFRKIMHFYAEGCLESSVVNSRFGWRIGSGNGGFPSPPLAPSTTASCCNLRLHWFAFNQWDASICRTCSVPFDWEKSGTVTQSPLEQGTSLFIGRRLGTSLSHLPIHHFAKVSTLQIYSHHSNLLQCSPHSHW